MATDPMPSEGDFFTVQEAADRLNVHPETVRTAVKHGRLAGFRAFNKLLIRKADVEAYRVAARPDGIKKVGRPRMAGLGGGKDVSSGSYTLGSEASLKPTSFDLEEETDNESRAFWVQSTNPETGNRIYGAGRPIHAAPLVSEGQKLFNLMPIIGRRIAERRRSLSLSQRELAERVGISREMLSHYEVGRVHINASDLFHVADALGIPIDVFRGTGGLEREGTDQMTPDEKEVLENYRRLRTSLKMDEILRLRKLAEAERIEREAALGLRSEVPSVMEVEGEKTYDTLMPTDGVPTKPY